MKRRAVILSTIVLALAGGRIPTSAQTVDSSPKQPPVKGADVDRTVLEVVEFSDFECPYCAMAVPVVDSLVVLYGNRVRVAYRHYPLPMHPHAERAAQAAVEAQRQGAFWGYHDLLFRNQDRLTDVDLIGYADSLDLDTDAFREALQNGWHAGAVARDRALGRELAVTGTPTFFVNGYRLVGAPPIRVFEEAIRAFEAGRVKPKPLEPSGPPR